MAGANPGGTTTTDGGASGANGAEGGTGTGGESAAGSGGTAGSNPEGGSGGAEEPCTPNPCENEGTCVSTGSQATCACAKGYTGERCELPVFEGIGVLEGKSYSGAVSGDGTTVVGGSGAGAIMWTSQVGIQALAGPIGYPDCIAFGTNMDGAVTAGGCRTTGTSRPVRWLEGKAEALAQGATSGYAQATDSSGSVVVGYIWAPGTVSRAFRWTQASGLVDIPSLLPGEATHAFATSADGSVVVGTSGNQGFRWSIASNPQSLGPRDCTPLATNADGTVIVGDMPNESGKSHAFRWTQADGLVDLGALATDPETHAWDVSADGNVIVGESGPVESGDGLIWTKASGLQPLQIVLANAGANLSGWRIGTAAGVSANGKVIVGWGTHNARTEGWIARLP